MKLAVMSDIHGNYIALEKCVNYALKHGVSQFLFLGDYVGELAYPERTMKYLYQLKEKYPCYFIKGNKEDYWISYHASDKKNWKDYDSTTGSLLYTYEHLTEKDIRFFEGLPTSGSFKHEGMPELLLCHGTPRSVKEKFLPQIEYEKTELGNAPIILCGHTHKQTEFMFCDKRVINPGSVGVALDSEGYAQFVILSECENDWYCEKISLAYDVENVIAQLHEEKLDEHAPCWCRITERLLRNGKIPHGTVLSKAMVLCQKREGFCKWPEIPEKYWEEAMQLCYKNQGM